MAFVIDNLEKLFYSTNMPLLVAILTLQILLGTVLVQSSLSASPVKLVRHSLKRVLGASLLAQDNTSVDSSQPLPTPTPDASTNNQPTDTPSPEPTQELTTTATPIPSETPSVTPTQTLSPNESGLTNTPDTNTTVDTPAPSAALTASPTAEISNNQENGSTTITTTPTPMLDNQDQSVINTDSSSPNPPPPVDAAIVNSDAAISSVSDISRQTIQQAQQQDAEINNTTKPTQQNQSLLQAAKENVISLNDTVVQNNYATEAFLAQRITDEVTKVVQNVQSGQLPSADISQAKTFCNQADLSLKTQQLLVPSDLEQDVEIARGLCKGIQ